MDPHEPAPTRATSALHALWHAAALPDEALQRIRLTGAEPAVASSFAVGSALQAALGAAALAAAEFGRLRGAAAQTVSVDMVDVVRESSVRFTLDGRTLPVWDKLSGLYRCGEAVGEPGRVRIHANFVHHRDGVLRLLGLAEGPDTERAAVEQALLNWSAEAFESAAAQRGLVVAMVRTPAQWRAHPQCAAVAALPLVSIERIDDGADAAPIASAPITAARPPLAGLRVLELTRILAGPVAGRTLAAYGADVLLINSPHLPNIEAIAETSRGKLSAHVDLRTEAGREVLRGLVRDADVFLQGYRPGGLAELGFAPEELARLRPGIVCVALSAYGHAGPWSDRRGFDSLVQSATGLNVAEAEAFGQAEPRSLPLQALDYGAGFLLAFGALAALARQRKEGGSWLVRVALARAGEWLEGLGRVGDGPQAGSLVFDGEHIFEASDSGFGRLVAVRHAARLSASPVGWVRPSMPPGSHPPMWPPR